MGNAAVGMVQVLSKRQLPWVGGGGGVGCGGGEAAMC